VERILFEDDPEWVGPKIWRFLASSPTILLTLAYIFLSGLGLLYQYVLFSEVGVSVLDYSEANDFLLAAFKNPEALALGAALVASLIFYRVVANYGRQRRTLIVRVLLLLVSWIGLFRREILIPIGIVYFLFLFVLATQERAYRLVFRSTEAITVTTRSGATTKYAVIPIGSTKSFLFGIDFSDDLVAARSGKPETSYRPVLRAFPFSDIVRIDYDKRTFSVPKPGTGR